MLKKVVVLLLCMMLVLPATVLAEETELPVLEKPSSLTVRDGGNNDLLLRLTQPSSIMEYMDSDDFYILYELDFKINDGPWKFDKNWAGVNVPEGVITYYEDLYDIMNVAGYLNFIGHDERNAIDLPIFPANLGLDAFDLQNNTYSFRYRYLYEYEVQDPATEEWGCKVIASPYSETATIGKAQGSAIPNSLEAPTSLKGELKTGDQGQPYFHFNFVIPQSVEEANKATEVRTKLDWKIGNGKWATELAGVEPFEKAGDMLSDDVDVDPIDEGAWGEIDIKENAYYFRAFFELEKPDGSFVKSPFSNVIEIGTGAFYSGASNWAKPELEKANELGLVPDILKGADMTKSITRAEFAAVAVKAYEALIGTAAIPAVNNPFTDTKDVEVLKAFNIGAVNGTSPTTFAPNALLVRQEAATMLTRVFKKVSLAGWTLATDSQFTLSYTKPAAFADDANISGWAKDSVYFMASNGIIGGVGNNKFAPKNTTTNEEATGYANATREQALIIAMRMVENLGD